MTLVEVFDIIVKNKPIFVIYSLNPLLTSIVACELFLNISKSISRVRIKAERIA